MTKLSSNEEFADFVGKYVTIDDNGTLRKYLVKSANKDAIIRNASYIIPGEYTILGQSDKQTCDICEYACINNVPVLKVSFRNGGILNDYRALVNGYVDERWEIFLNGVSLGTYDTNAFQADTCEIWFLPNSTNMTIDPDYVTAHGAWVGSAEDRIFAKRNLPLSAFNVNDWNQIEIVPVSENNTPLPPNFNNLPPDAFYVYPNIQLDIHKVFPTDTMSVSTLSCGGWQMWYNYQFQSSILDDIPFNIDSSLGFRKQEQLVHSLKQSPSSCFIYLDPCEVPFINYFNIDTSYYYRYYASEDTQVDGAAYPYHRYDTAIGYPDIIPTVLRRYKFYTSCAQTEEIVLYYENIPVSYNGLGARFYSDLGVTLFAGTAVYITSGSSVGTMIVASGDMYNYNIDYRNLCV